MIDVVCDLDGVVYLGDTVLDGVPDALRRLRDAGARILFVTNNAAKTPGQVAEKVSRLTGVAYDPADVCTSPEAAEGMLRDVDLPVYVVGDVGITEVLSRAGRDQTRDPGEARSVMVGLTTGLDYRQIAEAATALRNGARFIATNLDPTYPTTAGPLPGAGAIVAAIEVASGVEPEVAGKPYSPMRDLVKTRLSGPAWVIGDRVDTDMAMAHDEPGWVSVLVLSGATRNGQAGIDADHVVADLPAAVDLLLGEVGRR
ncbi:MAG: HAD-IIA family hydrolase [Actinobacteria bacterium]|nr:HAD-IIA family hydrolase [Actinomycetota bacterium]